MGRALHLTEFQPAEFRRTLGGVLASLDRLKITYLVKTLTYGKTYLVVQYRDGKTVYVDRDHKGLHIHESDTQIKHYFSNVEGLRASLEHRLFESY